VLLYHINNNHFISPHPQLDVFCSLNLDVIATVAK